MNVYRNFYTRRGDRAEPNLRGTAGSPRQGRSKPWRGVRDRSRWRTGECRLGHRLVVSNPGTALAVRSRTRGVDHPVKRTKRLAAGALRHGRWGSRAKWLAGGPWKWRLLHRGGRKPRGLETTAIVRKATIPASERLMTVRPTAAGRVFSILAQMEHPRDPSRCSTATNLASAERQRHVAVPSGPSR